MRVSALLSRQQEQRTPWPSTSVFLSCPEPTPHSSSQLIRRYKYIPTKRAASPKPATHPTERRKKRMLTFRKPSKSKSAATTTATAAAPHEGGDHSWGKHNPDGNWNGRGGGQGCSHAGYYPPPLPCSSALIRVLGAEDLAFRGVVVVGKAIVAGKAVVAGKVAAVRSRTRSGQR